MLVGPSAEAEVLTDRVPLMIPMIRSSPGGKGWELVYPRSLEGHVTAGGRTRSLLECGVDATARADGDLAVFPLPDGAIGGIELGPLLVRFREVPEADAAAPVVEPRTADETGPTAFGIAVVAIFLVGISMWSPRPAPPREAVEIAVATPTPIATVSPVASATSRRVAVATPSPASTAAVFVPTPTPTPTALAVAATATPRAATPAPTRDPLALAVGTPKVRPSATPASTPKPSGFLEEAPSLDDEQERFEARLSTLTLDDGTAVAPGGTVRDGGIGVVGRVDVGPAGTGDVKVASAGKVETPVEARMTGDAPRVRGTIDPERVQAVMQEAAGSFRQCYEAALRRTARLSGRVMLSWRIVEDGAVEEVGIAASTLRDEEIERCLTTRVRTLRFPRPDGGTVNVEYPLVFHPAVDPT